ncbi:MAG: TRAP transporter small permease [Elioraea sp.]|nr:TRAP transporter small permease [Elioraea sp.]
MSRPRGAADSLASFLEALRRLFDAFGRVIVAAAGLLLVVLVVALTWMVFGRYVLNDTPTWVERAAQLAILWVVLPAAAVGVRERFHMAVELGPSSLPPRLRGAVASAVDLALFGLGVLMAVWGWVLVETYRPFRIPLLGLSQGLQFAPVAIAGVLTCLFSAEALARRVVGLPPIAAAG